jgi:hypothetical protein
MNKLVTNVLAALNCAAFCAAFASHAGATVLHFDDLSGDESVAIQDGYGGLDWGNVATVSEDAYPGSGYAAGTVSHRNTAYNMNGATVTISKKNGSFDFAGAFFTSAWFDQELAFEGSRGGTLLYATAASYVIDTATPSWIGLGWRGIDTLTIYNSSGTPWAMDEFTVPEPASLALFGAACAGLVLARRRRPKLA